MKEIIDIARALIDPERMLDIAGEVSKHHRIQASPGFRAAAQFCRGWLADRGLDARILTYPADGVHRVPTSRTLREWAIQAGACEIEGFGPIADYSAAPLSVICRSVGCDFRQKPLEVVYLDKSADEADYAGLDLTGKLAFVRQNINDFAWVCQRRGGLGLITDFVLKPDFHQNVLRYTSYWWKEVPGETKYFGFCLSPAEGKRLAEHCLRARETGTPVLARGYIEAEFYDGTLDVVEAFLPGQTEQEIVVTAHLCHPATSSNDNASGVAASMEALYALKRAIDDGRLPAPLRGIRLLLLPEMSGTAAWLRGLDGPETARIVAALNLDMVGGDQGAGNGPLVLTSLPRSTPSFTEYAAMLALETAASQNRGFNPAQVLPSVSHAISTYSGGSDHYIFSDPTIGVPCTMLGQWPDRFYHTSGDTPDRLSPDTLTASCAAAFGFCARMAGLRADDLPALICRGKLRLAEELAALSAHAPEIGGRAAASHLLNTYKAALADALRLLPGDARVAAMVEAGQAELEAVVGGFLPPSSPERPRLPDVRVPVRRWVQPISHIDLAAAQAGREDALAAYQAGPQKTLPDAHQAEALAGYYMDGRRTVAEITELVELDTGRPAAAVQDYITLLAELGLAVFA